MNIIRKKVLHKEEVYLAGILLLLFVNTALAYLYPNPEIEYSVITNTIFLIHPIIAVIGGLSACLSFGFKSPHGKSFALITLGLFFLFFGEAIWAFQEIILRIDTFPSIADFFYLLAYPLLLFGIFREISYYQSVINPGKSILITIVSGFFSVAVSLFTIFPILTEEFSVFEKAIHVSYGVADILLIIGIAYILMTIMTIRGGRLFKAWLYILLASMLMFVGDMLFAYFSEPYEKAVPQFKQIDLFWIASYLLYAFGLFQMRFIIHDVQYKLKQLIEE